MSNKYITDFFIKLANLFLETDAGSKDWVGIPSLAQPWYWLFGTGIVYALSYIILFLPFKSFFEESQEFTLYIRVFNLAVGCLFLSLTFIFAYRYYRYVIQNRYKIYFGNIIFFYILGILGFFHIYFFLLFIFPSIFITHYAVYKTFMGGNPIPVKTGIMIYTLLKSLGASYNEIDSNSLIISFLNYLQLLYTFVLISLFISSYVNQNNSKSN